MKRSIHSILSNRQLDQQARGRLLKQALQYTDRLDNSLLETLKRRLVGWYGSEYLNNPDDFAAVVEFYSWLHERFPGDAQVTATLGDMLILDGQKAAGVALLAEALRLDPNTCVPGEFSDLLQEVGTDEQKLEVELAHIRFLLQARQWDHAKDEFGMLLARYGHEDVAGFLAREPYKSALAPLIHHNEQEN